MNSASLAIQESLEGPGWIFHKFPVNDHKAMVDLITKRGMIMIGKEIPLPEFLKLHEGIPTDGPEWLAVSKLFRSKSGNVFLLELPLHIHHVVRDEFIYRLRSATDGVAGPDRLNGGGSGTTWNSQGEAGESDAGFVTLRRPAGDNGGCDGRGNPWPNLILEVAVSQTFAQVESKILSFWLPSGVKIAVLIKIDTDEYLGNPGMFRRMRAAVYYRAQHCLANTSYAWFSSDGAQVDHGLVRPNGVTYCRTDPLDFGFVVAGGVPNIPAPGIGVHEIVLPSTPLFFGRPAGGPNLPDNFVLDLFSIAQSLRYVN
eukprot:Phypoly_transcript_09354.p1 GENE.Phypoly_transcript_09354~~Phypoly_transcript_09354.p1  ORF type:complete len:313 (+),score=30.00 Phypoly_transcript_09354:164-1102(+)